MAGDKKVKMTVYTISLIIGVEHQWKNYLPAYQYLERIMGVWKKHNVIIGYRIKDVYKHKGRKDFLQIDKGLMGLIKKKG